MSEIQLRWWGRFMLHPERAWLLGVLPVLVGLSFFLGKIWDWWPSSTVIAILPTVAVLLMALALTAGGIATIAGTLMPPVEDNLNKTWIIERMGLLIICLGWFAYALMLVQYYNETIISLAPPILYIIAALSRVFASLVAESVAQGRDPFRWLQSRQRGK